MTNMKSICFLLFLAGLPGLFSCRNPKNTGVGTEKNVSWTVKGCAESSSKPARISEPAKGGPGDFPEQWGKIVVAGDSLVYTRTLQHLCCRQVRLSADRKEGVIMVREYWYGKGCKCHCNSSLRLVVHQIPAGSYRVFVTEAGTDPVADKPVSATDTLLTQEIRITE